jgi:hypothetical protein
MWTGDWVIRAGLPILWLILNDIYKPAPREWDISVRYDGNTFFVFSQILSPSNAPYGLGTGENQVKSQKSKALFPVPFFPND